MNRYHAKFWLAFILIFIITMTSLAAAPARTDLDFIGTDLRDVFRALAAQFQVDIVVSEDVHEKVTLHLSRVTLKEALDILSKTYNLTIQKNNTIYHVNKAYIERCDISYADGNLTLSVQDTPLSTLLNRIQIESRLNLVFPRDNQRVSLTLYTVPWQNALSTIAELTGYTVEIEGDVATFRKLSDASRPNFTVRFHNKLLSVEAQNSPLTAVSKEITKQTGISVIPDTNLQANITVFFRDLPVAEGLRALASANGLRLLQESNELYRLTRGSGNASGLRVQYQNNLLSVDASGIEVTQVLEEISRVAKVNIISDQDVRGPITARFDNLSLATGLGNLLEANGFTLEPRERLFLVHKKTLQQGVRIAYDPGTQRFTLEIGNFVTLASVLTQVAQKAGINLVVYPNINASINNIFLRDVTLEQVLNLLLKGTTFVYKREGDTLLIGDSANLRPDNDLLETRLFYLNYIQAENVLNALPPNFPRQFFIVMKEQNALAVSGSPEFLGQVERYLGNLDIPKNQVRTEIVRIKNMKAEELLKLFPSSIPKNDLMVIKEGNAIAVTGTSVYTERVKNYIELIDIPNPLILFDVMVIQVNKDDQREWGIQSVIRAIAGDKNTIKYDANELIGDVLIPGSDSSKAFKVALKAAVEENKAKLWANPQITTLNGSPASFKVSTKDQMALPYESGVGEDKRTLYNIITIETGIQINIVPWVSANNDITLEIKPHISQALPKTTASSSEGSESTTPISVTDERSVETTVRVRDNATIIIGGLRQKLTSSDIKKIPILGEIPYLGKLFQYTFKKEKETEFIIVITPKLLSSVDAVQQAGEESVGEFSKEVQKEKPLG